MSSSSANWMARTRRSVISRICCPGTASLFLPVWRLAKSVRDSLVDLAILDRHMSWSGVVQAYQDADDKAGIVIPQFKERMRGAYYFKGLDGLRFYAKMGWEDAYRETRAFLLGLEPYI